MKEFIYTVQISNYNSIEGRVQWFSLACCTTFDQLKLAKNGWDLISPTPFIPLPVLKKILILLMVLNGLNWLIEIHFVINMNFNYKVMWVQKYKLKAILVYTNNYRTSTYEYVCTYLWTSSSTILKI